MKTVTKIAILLVLLMSLFPTQQMSVRAETEVSIVENAPIPTFLLPIPYVSQFDTGASTTGYDCGPTTVVIVLQALGKRPAGFTDAQFIADIRSKMGKTGSVATGSYDRQKALTAYGISSTIIASTNTNPLQTIRDAIAQGKPVIARVNGKDYLGRTTYKNGHVVVVVGFSSDGQTVYINDPDKYWQNTSTPGGGPYRAWPVSTFEAAMKNAPSIATEGYGLIVNQSLRPATCPANISGWKTEIFNGTNLAGPLAACRDDADLSFEWGLNSPVSVVFANNFSARFTKSMYFTAGEYTFSLSGDDGIRLYIDGNKLIDKWIDQGITEYSAKTNLSQGLHTVVVEYYEHTGGATVKLRWTPPNNVGPWTVKFYNNTTLSGTPAITTKATNVDFDWAYGSPASGIGQDNFSASFEATLPFAQGYHKLSLSGDDGIQLLVDGKLVIDQWRDQGYTTYTKYMYLTGGNHTVQVKYYERGGGAHVSLSYSKVKVVYIQSAYSQKYLDVRNVWTTKGMSAKLAGTIVQQYQLVSGNENQLWIQEDAGNGYYQFISLYSLMCLDVSGGAITQKTPVSIIQWPCHGGMNQQFHLTPGPNGTVFIQPRHSSQDKNGQALDVLGGNDAKANGIPIIQWHLHKGANQQWYIYENLGGTPNRVYVAGTDSSVEVTPMGPTPTPDYQSLGSNIPAAAIQPIADQVVANFDYATAMPGTPLTATILFDPGETPAKALELTCQVDPKVMTLTNALGSNQFGEDAIMLPVKMSESGQIKIAVASTGDRSATTSGTFVTLTFATQAGLAELDCSAQRLDSANSDPKSVDFVSAQASLTDGYPTPAPTPTITEEPTAEPTLIVTPDDNPTDVATEEPTVEPVVTVDQVSPDPVEMTPNVTASVQMNNKQYANATYTIADSAGNKVAEGQPTENGKIAIDLPADTYTFSIQAPGYLNFLGTFSVSSEPVQLANIILTPGDLNGDNVIEELDVLEFSKAYTSTSFVASADLNGDGQVSLGDFLLLATYYRQVGPTSWAQ